MAVNYDPDKKVEPEKSRFHRLEKVEGIEDLLVEEIPEDIDVCEYDFEQRPHSFHYHDGKMSILMEKKDGLMRIIR